MDDVETLVQEWLTIPDVADRLGVPDAKVRQMLQERQLVAVRRGEHKALGVPAVLLGPHGLLPELPGTLTVLQDAGFEPQEALRWLLTPDDSITGGSPIAALHAGHKSEVRRRAQALAV